MYKSFVFVINSLEYIGGAEKNLLTITNRLREINVPYKIIVKAPKVHNCFAREDEIGSIIRLNEHNKILKASEDFDSPNNLLVYVLSNLVGYISGAFPNSFKMAMWHGDSKLSSPNSGSTVKDFIDLTIRTFEFDYLSVLCDSALKEMRESYPQIAEKIIVQYNMFNGINHDILDSKADVEKKLVWIGNYKVEKGIAQLKELCKILSFSNYSLNIYGNWSSKDITSFYSGIPKESKSKIIIHGFLEDIDEIYRNAECLVSTSISEGWPMVFGDAHQRGIPVICFDSFTCVDCIIDDGNNGKIIESYNIQDMKDEIERIFVKNPYDSQSICEKSEFFNVKNRISDLINIEKISYKFQYDLFKYKNYFVYFENKVQFKEQAKYNKSFFKFLKNEFNVNIYLISVFDKEDNSFEEILDGYFNINCLKDMKELSSLMDSKNNVDTIIQLENSNKFIKIENLFRHSIIYYHLNKSLNKNQKNIFSKLFDKVRIKSILKNIRPNSLVPIDRASNTVLLDIYPNISYFQPHLEIGYKEKEMDNSVKFHEHIVSLNCAKDKKAVSLNR